MPVLKVQRAGGHHHNLIRSSHNKETRKYEKQRVRTAHNKTVNIRKAAELKALADARKAAAKLGCKINKYSSHTCSLGTRCCEVNHCTVAQDGGTK